MRRQLLQHRRDEGLDVLGLVVGRQDQPRLGGRHTRDDARQMTNAEIAAALDELGRPLRAGRRRQIPGARLRHRRPGDPREPGLGRRPRRRGPGDRDPRGRQDPRRKDRRPARDRRDPRRGEAEGEVPAEPDRGDADPRAGRENRAPALRRARNRHASTTSGRRPRASGSARSKGLGPKVEENVLAALERLGDRRAEATGRVLLSKAKPVAEALAAALREHPAAKRVEVAGSVRRWAETCKDIDLIATAEEPAALAEHLAAPLADRRRRQPRAQRRPRPDPQRDLGRPADRRPGGVRQPAPALHRLPGPQRQACARTRSPAASRSPSTGSPRWRAARPSSARPRSASTSGSATTTSSRSCARAGAS